MSYHAFISYASEDRDAAFEVCDRLEEAGLSCWIAPRNVHAGQDYGAEIIRGIEGSNCIVLVLSQRSNKSKYVKAEVERAYSKDKTVFLVRVDDIIPAQHLELFVSSSHWIDAFQGDPDEHFKILANEISGLSGDGAGIVSTDAASTAIKRGKLGSSRSKTPVIAAVTVVVVAIGVFLWQLGRTPTAGVSEIPPNSVAVLPFATAGTDSAFGSYASGLTHELRDRISGFQELQTIIAASNASPDSVSPNLVAYVVEGGIQRIGDGRRIRVQLIRFADRQVVWSETYDEIETNTVDPAVLAATMGHFIRLRLVQDKESQAVRRKSHSMEAAELVCAAQAQNYRINQRGAFDPQLMRTNAERAISLDPDLLEAYQALPVAYIFLGAYGQLGVEEASRLAHVALERALAIEPDDAYTLFLLGAVESNLDFDGDSAESTLRKAIANEPLHPIARWFHDQLGKIEIRRGNLAAAFDHYRRAIRIFESDGRILSEYAKALYSAGEFRDAIKTADVARTLSPSALYAWYLSHTKFYAQRSLGDETQAEATLNRYLSSAEPAWKPFAAGMLATAGRTDEARRSIASIESWSRPPTYPLSLAYVELGEHDQAFEWLRKGIEGSDFILINWIRVDTAFVALRKDPRWEEAMDQLERQEAKGRARNQQYGLQ